ncbi:MAG: biotin-dependent carboxyltransferase family protein [Candidatus Puniceispirillaceae bacterium]
MPEFVSIFSAGPHCSLQDGGRVGHQAFGVPEGGAMDRDALILGNRLVGNPPDAAGLEICLGGLSFSPTIALRIALTGTAGDRLTITRTSGEILEVDAGISVVAEAGDIISTGFFRDTNCAFIAIGSQFDIGAPFGSQSTSANARMGGIDGRLLADGDRIPLGRPAPPAPLRQIQTAIFARKTSFHIVPGPQQSWFEDAAYHQFIESEWRLTSKMSRMGIRLAGPVISHRHTADILSDGIVRGAIQIPGDGQPIVMMNDHQTTGGYTKIASICSADQPAFARLSSASKVTFLPVTQTQAEELAIAHQAQIDRIISEMITV